MGFVYVALVIDCFSRAIVGWQVSRTKDTAMVTTALKMALWRRDHHGHTVGEGLIHHSDAGSQYTSIAFAETLVLEGIAASIGSVGDAYDNALAETTIGLFKTEAIGQGSPFRSAPLRTLDDVEYATMEWVDWYNNRRLHSVLDYVPPVEYETAFHRSNTRPPTTLNSGRPSRRCLKHEAGIKPGTVQLDLLNNSPGGSVQMGNLAEALAAPPSRLTRQIKRLELRGLVHREASPHDRRCVVATITDTGQTSVAHAMITYANAIRTHFLAPLTRPRIAAVGVTCRQISTALKSSGRSGAT